MVNQTLVRQIVAACTCTGCGQTGTYRVKSTVSSVRYVKCEKCGNCDKIVIPEGTREQKYAIHLSL